MKPYPFVPPVTFVFPKNMLGASTAHYIILDTDGKLSAKHARTFSTSPKASFWDKVRMDLRLIAEGLRNPPPEGFYSNAGFGFPSGDAL